jgi:hypothetical protein
MARIGSGPFDGVYAGRATAPPACQFRAVLTKQ